MNIPRYEYSIRTDFFSSSSLCYVPITINIIILPPLNNIINHKYKIIIKCTKKLFLIDDDPFFSNFLDTTNHNNQAIKIKEQLFELL